MALRRGARERRDDVSHSGSELCGEGTVRGHDSALQVQWDWQLEERTIVWREEWSYQRFCNWLKRDRCLWPREVVMETSLRVRA